MTTPSALWPKSEGGGREYDERLNGNETPGFNLESDCLRSVPRCRAWLRAARCEKPFCYVSVRQHMCARAYSVYTMGWDPRGWVEGCHVKVTLEGRAGEGEATCLPAVAKRGWQPSTCLRTLSLKTPSAHPLWDLSGPGDPVTLTVFQLTGPPVQLPQGQLKLPPFTSDQRPFWATVIEYNTLKGFAADVCSFYLASLLLFFF